VTTPGQRVLVIGGGVIGLACAHFLSRAGCSVSVIDKGAIGRACSHGNCGFVCPSHVLPLAEPGAIRHALASMFQPNSPFYIKPRLNLGLWTWLLHFARRCNARDMRAAGHVIQILLQSSMKLYETLIEEDGIACEWQKHGLLFVFQSLAAWERYEATNRLLTEEFHEPARRLTGEQLVRLEPALRTNLAGGWYYERDAHLRPDRLMSSWRERLGAEGVTFVDECDFRGFVTGAGGPATAATTSKGELAADGFVVATGAWTPLLNRELGCRVPIQPGKGYSITMPRPAACPNIPMLFPEHRVGVTPMLSGFRLGSIMEFAGYDDSLDPRQLALLTDGARHYLREPCPEPILERWFGWRPMTWDSLPIIDRSPAFRNVWIAAGHNMLGLSMAPATGKLIAELLTEEKPHVDPRPYRADRFG
jgi:D-amino-acid dehydrogenase